MRGVQRQRHRSGGAVSTVYATLSAFSRPLSVAPTGTETLVCTGSCKTRTPRKRLCPVVGLLLLLTSLLLLLLQLHSSALWPHTVGPSVRWLQSHTQLLTRNATLTCERVLQQLELPASLMRWIPQAVRNLSVRRLLQDLQVWPVWGNFRFLPLYCSLT